MKKYLLITILLSGCITYVPTQLARVNIVDKKPTNCEMLEKIDSTYNPDNEMYGFSDKQDAIDYIKLYTVSMEGDTAWIEREVKSKRADDNVPVIGHIAYAYKCNK